MTTREQRRRQREERKKCQQKKEEEEKEAEEKKWKLFSSSSPSEDDDSKHNDDFLSSSSEIDDDDDDDDDVDHSWIDEIERKQRQNNELRFVLATDIPTDDDDPNDSDFIEFSDDDDGHESDDDDEGDYEEDDEEDDDALTPPPAPPKSVRRITLQPRKSLRRRKNKQQDQEEKKTKQKQKEKMNAQEQTDFSELLTTVLFGTTNTKKRQRNEGGGGGRPGERLTRQQATKRRRAALPNSILAPPPFVPKNLTELIDLARLTKKKVFRDCQRLFPLLQPLEDLHKLIGLTSLKQDIVDLLLMRLQKPISGTGSHIEMPHLVLTGDPGVGKTTVSRIIARLFNRLGLLASDKIVEFKPTTAISGFLGQTALKTESLIKSAFGGVLLIDEASSLTDGRSVGSGDSFSKSAIDTLNSMLTEHGDKFVAILAGYRDEIQRDFFSVNPGLSRRFPTRWHLDAYKPDELMKIASLKLNDKKYVFDSDVIFNVSDFADTKKLFKNGGGSVGNLIDKIVVTVSCRTFGALDKNSVTRDDVLKAITLLKRNNLGNDDDDAPPSGMYN
jgi:hypothetical protein